MTLICMTGKPEVEKRHKKSPCLWIIILFRDVPLNISLYLIAELSQQISQNCDWTVTNKIKKKHVWLFLVCYDWKLLGLLANEEEQRARAPCMCAGTSQTVDKYWQVIGSFIKDVLNPLLSSSLLGRSLISTAASENSVDLRPGLSPRISSLSLACCQVHALIPSAHTESFTPHKLITGTIISSQRNA